MPLLYVHLRLFWNRNTSWSRSSLMASSCLESVCYYHNATKVARYAFAICSMVTFTCVWNKNTSWSRSSLMASSCLESECYYLNALKMVDYAFAICSWMTDVYLKEIHIIKTVKHLVKVIATTIADSQFLIDGDHRNII